MPALRSSPIAGPSSLTHDEGDPQDIDPCPSISIFKPVASLTSGPTSHQPPNQRQAKIPPSLDHVKEKATSPFPDTFWTPSTRAHIPNSRKVDKSQFTDRDIQKKEHPGSSPPLASVSAPPPRSGKRKRCGSSSHPSRPPPKLRSPDVEVIVISDTDDDDILEVPNPFQTSPVKSTPVSRGIKQTKPPLPRRKTSGMAGLMKQLNNMEVRTNSAKQAVGGRSTVSGSGSGSIKVRLDGKLFFRPHR